jgi:hypothetical protein
MSAEKKHGASKLVQTSLSKRSNRRSRSSRLSLNSALRLQAQPCEDKWCFAG